MPQPLYFDTSTTRFSLPLLFAGQAQKEFYVNDALVGLDILTHLAVKGIANSPPASPGEGDIWLASYAADGAWADQRGDIAAYISDSWRFFAPVAGMRVFDEFRGQFIHFDGSWRVAEQPAAPAGGANIDVEARASIDELIEALKIAGIFRRN